MAKENCLVCGKEIGFLGGISIKDGRVCTIHWLDSKLDLKDLNNYKNQLLDFYL